MTAQSNVFILRIKSPLGLPKIGNLVLLLCAGCFSFSAQAEKRTYQIISLPDQGLYYEKRTTDSAETNKTLKKNKPQENQQQLSYNGTRGGGGGGFLCQEGKSKTAKLFSIDFLLAQNKSAEQNFGPRSTCMSIIESIRQRLVYTNPALAVGLADFMAAADKSLWQRHDQLNPSRTLPQRLWVQQCSDSGMGCMPNIPDDQLEQMPNTCFQKVQIAERIPWSNANKTMTIMTLVDVKAVQELEKYPIQCSHFYVHEWLRDFVAEAKDIRDLTSYFHSEAFFQNQARLLPYLPSTIGTGFDSPGRAADSQARSYYNEKILKAWFNPYEYSLGRDTKDSLVTLENEIFGRGQTLASIALRRNQYLQRGALRSYIEIKNDGYHLTTVWENRK